MDEDKKSDELLNLIRNELKTIIEEQESGGPMQNISYEDLLKSNTMPATKSYNNLNNKTKNAPKRGASYRQALGGKSINMRPSKQQGVEQQKQEAPTVSPVKPDVSIKTTSTNCLGSDRWPPEHLLRTQLLDSQAAQSIDEDLQKMQVELKQSYELFQGISEKLKSISFSSLKNRIRDLHLNTTNNEIGKATTIELQKVFENRFVENRLDKLSTDVSNGFRRHPGEFGDIPELSTFFKACSQLEHGLDNLKKHRKNSSDMEKRLCWATEIAYDRMDEIRNAVGSKPETNF